MLLGAVRAWRDDVELDLGSPQQRTMLALLLLRANHPVSIEEIIDSLWGDDVPRSARAVVRTYVHRLRRVLGNDDSGSLMRSSGVGYTLSIDASSVDVTRFWEALASADAANARGDAEQAVRHLRAALGLWSGQPLKGISSVRAGGPLDTERARLLHARAEAVEALGGLQISLGRYREAAAGLAVAVQEEPYRERLHELLITALYRSGRLAEALIRYDKVREVLSDELGVEPSPGLRELHRSMLAEQGTSPDEDPRPGDLRTVRPAQLPADLAVFAGREAEVEALLDWAHNLGPGPRPPAVCLIHGTPGVGTTTFALRCAHRLADRFVDGELYLNLHGSDATNEAVDPLPALHCLLTALGVPPASLPAGQDAASVLFRSLVANRRFLIVLDNACSTSQVLPLLPGGSGNLVLVTSSKRLPGLVSRTGARTVALNVLTPAEAQQFMVNRLGAERVAAEPTAAADIIALAGRLPLALATVCARAASHPHFTLAAIVEELLTTRGSLAGFTSSESLTDIQFALSNSYRALSRPAAELFRFLSVYPPTDMSVGAVASLVGSTACGVRGLLQELSDAHLVDEPAPGRFSMHELVRVYSAQLLEVDDRRAALKRLLDYHLEVAGAESSTYAPYDNVNPPLEPLSDSTLPAATWQQARSWFHDEYRTLLALVGVAAANGFASHSWMLVWVTRRFLAWRGNWPDLRLVHDIALRAAELAGDQRGVAYMLLSIASVDSRFRSHDRALLHLAEAIELFRGLGDRKAEAFAHQQVAGVLQLQGDRGKALDHAQTARDLLLAVGTEAENGSTIPPEKSTGNAP